MPFEVAKQGSRYCVRKKGGGKSYGCHPSKAAATQQMRALYAAEDKGVIGDLDMVATAKDYELELSIYGRQVSQDMADYNPLGASSTKGCANCQWFVSPRQCLLVAGEISPTGLSSLWREKEVYSPEPVEVVIVGDETKDLGTDDTPLTWKNLLPRLKELLTVDTQENPLESAVESAKQGSGLALFKQSDGRFRYVMVASNKFRDRDLIPEILSEQAHKEFIQWAEETNNYPEAWLWHTPGTKWGKSDWLEYADGFLVESGLVDADKESVAQSLANDSSLLVSHGYFVLQRNAKDWTVIDQYRQFESSPLPADKAANVLTGIGIYQEDTMSFTAEKRSFLESKLGAEGVKTLETQVHSLADVAKKLGLESKDILDAGLEAAGEPPAPEPEDEEEEEGTEEEKASKFAELVSKNLGLKELSDMLAGIKETTDKIPAFESRLSKLEQGFDKAISEAVRPASEHGALVWQKSASQDKSNQLADDDPLKSKQAAPHLQELDEMIAPMFSDSR